MTHDLPCGFVSICCWWGTVRIRSTAILSCTLQESFALMCSHPLCHALLSSDTSVPFYQCLPWAFLIHPSSSFSFLHHNPHPPAPSWSGPTLLHFMLLCSNHLNQTSPVSSIISSTSPSTDLLFPYLLLLLMSSTVTVQPPKPLSPLESPQLLTDTHQRHPITPT